MDFFFFTIHSWCFFYLGCRGGFWASFSFWFEGMFRLSQVAGEIIGGNFDFLRTRVKLFTCPPTFLGKFIGLAFFCFFFLGVFSRGGGILRFSWWIFRLGGHLLGFEEVWPGLSPPGLAYFLSSDCSAWSGGVGQG